MNSKVHRTIAALIALLLLFSDNITVYAFSLIANQTGDAAARSAPQPWVTAAQAPVIDVWDEANLKFGEVGNPQRWVNILGNVRDVDGGSITSLRYSLNGAPSVKLDLGPDAQRLVNPGDFNVSLAAAALKDGANSLVLTATDDSGATQTKTVAFSYRRGRTWPFPYLADWSKSRVIQDQAQVVDGAWQIDTGAGRIYPTQFGYDRVVAIGDMGWTDYEVTVPITVYAFTGDSSDPGGVGVITRWQGHSGSGQPPTGWNQIGSYVYYSKREEALALRLNDGKPITQIFPFQYNTTYIFKTKVETTPSGGRYSFKVWVEGQPEPAWTSSQYSNIVNVVDSNNDMLSGSVLLVAHKVNAAFGNVLICPIDATYALNLSNSSGGKATSSGGRTNYACGERVQVTAEADPGYTFSGWSGSITGMTNPVTLEMLKAYNLKANFTPNLTVPFKLYIPQLVND